MSEKYCERPNCDKVNTHFVDPFMLCEDCIDELDKEFHKAEQRVLLNFMSPKLKTVKINKS